MNKIEFYIWAVNHQKMYWLLRLLASTEFTKEELGDSIGYFCSNYNMDYTDNFKRAIELCKFRKVDGTPAFRFFSGIQKCPNFGSHSFKVGENGKAIYACFEDYDVMSVFKGIISSGLMDGCIISTRHVDEGVVINRLYFVDSGAWVLLCDMALSSMVDMCQNRA